MESSLADDGFTVTTDSVAGRRTVVGRRSSLRRHTFVLVAVFKADATPEHLDRFRTEAHQYARTVRGGPVRGTHTLAVAVVASTRETGGWGSGAGGAGGAYPVLVDLGSGRVTTPGGASDPYPERLVRDHVVPAVNPPARS